VKTYRVSALASAAVRMWRAWSVVLPVVVVNAAAQGALVYPEINLEPSVPLALALVASAVLFVFAYGLLASAALHTPDGHVGWRMAWAGLRARLLPFLLWSLGLLIAVSVGLAVHLLVAVLIVGLTAFVLFAVLEGRSNPLWVNLRTIGRRIWRWLATGVVVVLLVTLGVALMGVTQFFLRGWLGATVTWLVAGLLIAWLITARALLYRSAWAEPSAPTVAEARAEEPTPDLA